MNCPKCNKEIKYIAYHDTIIPLDIKEKEVFTKTGKKIKGFEEHICECCVDKSSVGKEA